MPERFSYSPNEFDRPREECGVFGIYFPHRSFREDIIQTTLSGLIANQHRGEESAGIVTANGERVSLPLKRMGLVRGLFREYRGLSEDLKNYLHGHISVSHTRYSTTGSSNIENAAPFLHEDPFMGSIAASHNGNITNAHALKEVLHAKGYTFASTTDSEIIGPLIADSPGETWDEKITAALRRLEGSFSLLLMTKDALYGARDPLGNRPLSFAQFQRDGINGYALSSESPAFDNLGISYQREVYPGELIKFDKKGMSSVQFTESEKQALCGLEIAYLMRADSRIEGIQLDTIRRLLGGKLAEKHPIPKDVDFITYIPESARSAAEGFSEQMRQLGLDVPIRTSMMKNRYGVIGGAIRGFINPNEETRTEVARGNYYPFDLLVGKKIGAVDDSIIRGKTTGGVIQTLKRYVGFLRDSGVAEVHLRIVFPPVIDPCPLGTDINNKDFLVAQKFNSDIDEIAQFLGADSLAYLSPEDYGAVVNEALKREFGLCLGCTTGEYPVGAFRAEKNIFENV